MTQHFLTYQCALAFQYFDDMVVGGKHVLAGKQVRIRQETTVAADRVIDIQPVTTADDVIVLTMSRRGMHGTGTGLGGDVITEDDRHFTVVEWMTETDTLQVTATVVNYGRPGTGTVSLLRAA